MSLQTAVSGLLGAQTGIDTTSNDLANASTTGFKSQTALFADVYPAGSSNVPGIGVTTSSISSDFAQGDTTSTGNDLNVAVQGSGFFITDQDGENEYTRDGAFQLSTTGELTTATGAPVLGFAQNANGTAAGTLSALTINTGSVAANPTTSLGLALDLDSGDDAPTTAVFDPATSTSYNDSTSIVAYDTLGNANNVQLYFVKTTPTAAETAAGATSSYTVYSQTAAQSAAETAQSSGSAASNYYSTVTTLNFNSSGALINDPPTATIAVAGINGAATSNVTFNFDGTTLGAQSFAVAGTTNNGYAPGSFSGATISSTGQVKANYSNGQSVTVGTLGIANFINQEGLTPTSGNLYAASSTSGTAVVDTPGTGQAGTLQDGSLESSNVSTSALLVSLIQYQQAYQANAFDIQTEQQDSQRLTQI
jgi:flagellar hook protein FlgE